MKSWFLIKTENETVQFVTLGEFGTVLLSSTPKSISQHDLDYFSRELFAVSPQTMFGGQGEELALPSNVHRLSEISYAKPEAKFELRLVEVDFLHQTFISRAVWHYDVKNWPNGHVLITSAPVE